MAILDRTESRYRSLAWTLYWVCLIACLPFATPLRLVAWIAVLIVSYIRKTDSKGTIYSSHFENIFFVAKVPIVALLLILVLTFATLGFGGIVTYPVMIVVFIWVIYRLIRGMLYLSDGKAMWASADLKVQKIPGGTSAGVARSTPESTTQWFDFLRRPADKGVDGSSEFIGRATTPTTILNPRTEKELILEQCAKIIAPFRSPTVMEDPTEDIFHVLFAPIPGRDPSKPRNELVQIVETSQNGSSVDLFQIEFASKDRRDFVERELRDIFQDAELAVSGEDGSGTYKAFVNNTEMAVRKTNGNLFQLSVDLGPLLRRMKQEAGTQRQSDEALVEHEKLVRLKTDWVTPAKTELDGEPARQDKLSQKEADGRVWEKLSQTEADKRVWDKLSQKRIGESSGDASGMNGKTIMLSVLAFIIILGTLVILVHLSPRSAVKWTDMQDEISSDKQDFNRSPSPAAKSTDMQDEINADKQIDFNRHNFDVVCRRRLSNVVNPRTDKTFTLDDKTPICRCVKKMFDQVKDFEIEQDFIRLENGEVNVDPRAKSFTDQIVDHCTRLDEVLPKLETPPPHSQEEVPKIVDKMSPTGTEKLPWADK